MDKETALEIRNKYEEYDNEYRVAKKRGDYRKASEYKAKRDALAAQLAEAVKVLREKK